MYFKFWAVEAHALPGLIAWLYITIGVVRRTEGLCSIGRVSNVFFGLFCLTTIFLSDISYNEQWY